MIYFDNSATSFPNPEIVYRTMDDFMRREAGNPGRSGHKLAVSASLALTRTRLHLARLFHVADADRIVFTLNATDALNLALKGFLREGDHVVTTSMEHNSVVRPLAALRRLGVRHTRVPCDVTGLVDVADIAAAVESRTRMIVMSHASNVVGTVQPIATVGRLARERGLIFLVDAAQSAGVLPIDVEADMIDLLAFPGHKSLYGPTGTGGLYVGPRVSLTPQREGGTGSESEQEDQPERLPDRFESGTQNTVGIAGLGAGVEYVLAEGLERIAAHERALTQRLLDGLAQIPGVALYGSQDASRRTAAVSFNLAGWEPVDLGAVLDQSFDIAVRPGLHCAPAAHQTIGTFPQGTVRLSPGYFNTPAEVDFVLEAIAKLSVSGLP